MRCPRALRAIVAVNKFGRVEQLLSSLLGPRAHILVLFFIWGPMLTSAIPLASPSSARFPFVFLTFHHVSDPRLLEGAVVKVWARENLRSWSLVGSASCYLFSRALSYRSRVMAQHE